MIDFFYIKIIESEIEEGLCIIQEVKVCDEIDYLGNFCVAFHDNEEGYDDLYIHGRFTTYQKAIKRMKLIESEEIEF